MEARPAKRAHLSLEDVITELEEEEVNTELEDEEDEFSEYRVEVDGPVMPGSDDEWEDLQFEERERECLEIEEEEFHDDEDRQEEGELQMATWEMEERENEGEEGVKEHADGEEERQETERELEKEGESDERESGVDEEEDTESTGVKWCSILKDVIVHPFAEHVGPAFDVSSSPSAVFRKFFTDEICTLIVEQSNLYAQQVLGFRICMGIVQLPAMRHYWSREPLLHQSAIADRISRDRFFDISRFLHFANNDTLPARGEPGHDRLGKIRPVLEAIQTQLLANYAPHCEQAVDEAMIPFQGRSSLKQFMPAKPVKRGIKVWCRADSHNGYMCEVQVYTGAVGSSETGLGERVVLDLAQKLEGKQYHLYFDNFFTSTSLLSTLLSKGVYATGTARQHYKGFPAALKMKGKGKREQRRQGLNKRGDSRTLQSGNMTATIWLDKKVVTVMSTGSQPKDKGTVLRKKQDGSKEEVPCPSSVVMYNKYMRGVDRNDQLRKYYHVNLKGRKYYRYLFWFLFEVCVTNAFVLHREYSREQSLKHLLQFRIQLHKELVGNYCSRKRPGRPSSTPVSRPSLPYSHFPVKQRAASHSGRSRCWYCSHARQPARRRETLWFCRECDLHFCHTGESDDCFLLYHQTYTS